VSPIEQIGSATPRELLLIGAKTGPLTEEQLRDRLVEELHLVKGDLRASSRPALLQEPFIALKYMHERNYASGDAHLVTGLFALPGVVLLAIGLICFWTWYTDPTAARHSIVPWMIGVTALGLTLASIGLYRVLTDRSRVARKAVLPHLARSLLRLEPKEIDLERTMRQLAAAGSSIARSLSAKSIVKEMEKIRVGGWVAPKPEEIA
jgi:hypothetical protein